MGIRVLDAGSHSMDFKRAAAMVAFAFVSGSSHSAAGGPLAEVLGAITLTAADGATFPAAGTRITVRCAADDVVRFVDADENGAFRFTNLPPDTCSIATDLQGFEPATATVVTAAGMATALDLHLVPARLRTGVFVTDGAGSTYWTAKRRSGCRSRRSRSCRKASRRERGYRESLDPGAAW